jgi:hypothetical protein
MIKILYHFFSVAAFASPGNGHSHVVEDGSSSAGIGIVVILVIAGMVFWLMKDKKK